MVSQLVQGKNQHWELVQEECVWTKIASSFQDPLEKNTQVVGFVMPSSLA